MLANLAWLIIGTALFMLALSLPFVFSNDDWLHVMCFYTLLVGVPATAFLGVVLAIAVIRNTP